MAYSGRALTALAEDALVELAHLGLGRITLAVAGKRKTRNHPVEGRETMVEVVVHLCEVLRKAFADLLALQRPSGGENRDFRHCLVHAEGTPLIRVP